MTGAPVGGAKGVGLTEHGDLIPQHQDCELCGSCDLGTWGRWGFNEGQDSFRSQRGRGQTRDLNLALVIWVLAGYQEDGSTNRGEGTFSSLTGH